MILEVHLDRLIEMESCRDLEERSMISSTRGSSEIMFTTAGEGLSAILECTGATGSKASDMAQASSKPMMAK